MAASQFSVLKKAHTGITVSSLQHALEFWQGLLGGQLLYRNHVEMSAELNVVGIPGAIMDNAMLALPDGSMIELLEYSAPADRKSFRPRPVDVGSVHVALEVKGSRGLIEGAAALGWTAAANGEPQRLRRGDGSYWTALYIFGPDGETVELLEKLQE